MILVLVGLEESTGSVGQITDSKEHLLCSSFCSNSLYYGNCCV